MGQGADLVPSCPGRDGLEQQLPGEDAGAAAPSQDGTAGDQQLMEHMEYLREELASQMELMNREVARVEEKLLRIQHEAITSGSEDGHHGHRPSPPPPLDPSPRRRPIFRRQSSYCEDGKVPSARSGPGRRISWDESVVDNAKLPGELTLSGLIRRRSARRRRRQDTNPLSTTLACVLAVVLLSNMIPFILQHILETFQRLGEPDAHTSFLDGLLESHAFQDD
uniref:Uncharacterized protein n=1 Tax=Rhizochromulina marina TaxID=1034831 RepID=A0A7S2RAK2_9STRA|mmetsp:Transcript_13482/g.39259  ORF Transcript_13482/g.39259 Transcript_13482/m.39259 type:complete len:223 (+) Transcript_13482:49-717(+)